MTRPTIDNAVGWFGAHIATHCLDVSDREADAIVEILDSEGSTVRFYNADGHEFMTLKSDDASKRFQPLFDRRLAGVRHAEDGTLYALLEGEDEGTPVGPLPFQSVQVGPFCESGNRIAVVRVEYGPADVTVSLGGPYTEFASATRPYTESEADWLL